MKAFFIRTNKRRIFFVWEYFWSVEGGYFGGVPGGELYSMFTDEVN